MYNVITLQIKFKPVVMAILKEAPLRVSGMQDIWEKN